jgi:predicted AlkP superfamily pyrophosphatase or phosphodiesterase
MKTIKHRKMLPFLFISLFFLPLKSQKKDPPKLAIVIVIDALSHRLLEKVTPHLRGGLKTLLKNGVQFSQAYQPHAKPSTATGHAGLLTGTWPKYHGFIGNSWWNATLQAKVKCDDDARKESAVFTPDGNTYSYGKSGHQLMTDNLVDQLTFASTPDAQNQTFALSIKNRAAIAMAGKTGKAIWFDDKKGMFTSSKAYFTEIPTWVNTFNKKQGIAHKSKIHWHRKLAKNHPGYRFPFISNYDYSNYKKEKGLIGRPLVIDKTKERPFREFNLTPHANKLVFDLAKKCLEQNFDTTKNGTFLLLLSVNSLDKTQHYCGPDSLEAYDTLYHIDAQLKRFLTFINKNYKKCDPLFFLTSDHGFMPIPEINNTLRGMKNAVRVQAKDLIQQMNVLANQNFGIHELVRFYEAPMFYLDKKKLKELEKNKKRTIICTLQRHLENNPAIKRVWHAKQLAHMPTELKTFEDYLKNQYYKGRSGDLFCLFNPYATVTPFAQGTGHRSPYHYDTHVPLIFYQKRKTKQKVIRKKVWVPQVAATLAQLLHIAQPSACQFDPLPGI